MLQLHFLFLSLLMRFLKLAQFKYRYLTPAEIQLCQSVFGHLIDYSKVRVMNHTLKVLKGLNRLRLFLIFNVATLSFNNIVVF